MIELSEGRIADLIAALPPASGRLARCSTGPERA
jgi:hypothetical protein